MGGDGSAHKPSTEQALESWRVASREVDHRKRALGTAETASAAAEKAERAAQDTARATDAAMEAASRARVSATAAAEAASITREQVDADRADAHAKLASAIASDDDAREQYRQAQDRAFERYGRSTNTIPEREASGAA
jgi:hypothetical protein